MKNFIKSLLAITALIFISSSCEKDSVDPVDPDPIIGEIHITEDITENTIWEAKYVYYIDLSVAVINDAILTIEPGTTIKFALGKYLYISDGVNKPGNIIALGTEKDPILFTSQAQLKSKGDWNSLWLWPGSNASKFSYCTFEYAGGANDAEGAISIKGAENVAIENCSFKKNANYGVYVYNSPTGLSSFIYNTFTDNTTNDLQLRAYNVSFIGEGNVFSKNIEVKGSNVDAPGDVVWRKQNADYIIIERDIDVGSSTGTNLIIEAGASLKFSNFGMTVAYYGTKYGMIEAIGTATDPISFTSAASSPSKGDWGTIRFYDGSSTSSVFDYCNFSYGGGEINSTAMISFQLHQGSTTTIKNCSFSNSEGYGIMLYQPTNDTSYPTLMNNSFSNNTLGDKNW